MLDPARLERVAFLRLERRRVDPDRRAAQRLAQLGVHPPGPVPDPVVLGADHRGLDRGRVLIGEGAQHLDGHPGLVQVDRPGAQRGPGLRQPAQVLAPAGPGASPRPVSGSARRPSSAALICSADTWCLSGVSATPGQSRARSVSAAVAASSICAAHDCSRAAAGGDLHHQLVRAGRPVPQVRIPDHRRQQRARVEGGQQPGRRELRVAHLLGGVLPRVGVEPLRPERGWRHGLVLEPGLWGVGRRLSRSFPGRMHVRSLADRPAGWKTDSPMGTTIFFHLAATSGGTCWLGDRRHPAARSRLQKEHPTVGESRTRARPPRPPKPALAAPRTHPQHWRGHPVSSSKSSPARRSPGSRSRCSRGCSR